MAVILIIDDEKSIRVTSTALLKAAGHSVFTASGHAEAMAQVDEQDIDVAVVDVLLGPDNGVDIAKAIRNQEPNTQIIFVTGEPELQSAREAIQLHAFDYLSKPVGKDVIIGVVGRAAEEKQRRDAGDRAKEEQGRYKQELEAKVEERTAEIALRERQYRELVENLNDVIFEVTVEGLISYISPIVEAVLGYRADQLVGNVFEPLIHPDDLAQIRQALADQLAGHIYPSEYRMLKQDGSYLWVKSSSRLMRAEDGRPSGIRGVLTNINERKAMEAHLAEAGKMKALGTLCAGVSHEYNNILMGIVGYAHHLKKQLKAGSVGYGYAEKIQSLSDQAAEVSRQLLNYSRPDSRDRQEVDLDMIVNEAVETFGGVLGEDLNIVLTLQSGARVSLNKAHFREILLNLLLNSRDAMSGGGKIIVKTSRHRPDAETGKRWGLGNAHDYAELSVTDPGKGMSPDVLDRVFEPFFTTKEVGQGTGLGLSSASGILRSHGGAIAIESEPGKGTTVKVYLPVV